MSEPAPSTADPPPQAGKRRGNPNLHLAPRCGARTRAGCPCQAPAIRGKRRCRMHGGRSTGPRTPEGKQRVREARLTRGATGAARRASNLYVRVFCSRGRLYRAAMLCLDWLAPDFAERLWNLPRELMACPPRLERVTVAEERALRRAERAALTPWRAAIAEARQARKAAKRAGPAATGQRSGPDAAAAMPAGAPPAPQERTHAIFDPEAHAPEALRAAFGASGAAAEAVRNFPVPEPLAPDTRGSARVTPVAAPAATCKNPPQGPLAPEALCSAAADPADAPQAVCKNPVQQLHAPEAPSAAPASQAAAPPSLNRAARRYWERQQRRQRKHAPRHALGHAHPAGAPHRPAGKPAAALASPARPL